jgi:hypothetical protein
MWMLSPRLGEVTTLRRMQVKWKRRAFARRFVSMDARVKPGHDGQY